MTQIYFPGKLHSQATEAIKGFFLEQQGIDTILLVNSIARGKATPESDIDIAILISEITTAVEMSKLESAWNYFLSSDLTLKQFRNSARFAQVHLDIINGIFEPGVWEEGGGIDFFEVEIGNMLLYSAPLNGEGVYFKKLKSKWLPYYNTELQVQRLQLAKLSCLYELGHINSLVRRGLHFHAFDRLYVAFQKFLQTLFIKHQTYPIAYNKWIKDQVVEILKLPELYRELPAMISVNKLESDEVIEKAMMLKGLLAQYC